MASLLLLLFYNHCIRPFIHLTSFRLHHGLIIFRIGHDQADGGIISRLADIFNVKGHYFFPFGKPSSLRRVFGKKPEMCIRDRQGASTFTLPFSMMDLADFLSVNRSAMVRELKSMREDGLVAVNRREITLL